MLLILCAKHIKMNQLIFLVGFMGSGKSTIGRRLATALGAGFQDLDTIIEKTEGQSISTIFSTKGEDYFREIESQHLKSISASEQVKVIAVGGGTPCFFDNMDWMNAHGMTFFLNPSIDILYKRLQSETAHRPILSGKTEDSLRQFMIEKLDARLHHYRKAQFIIDINSHDFDAVKAITSFM